MSIIETFLNVIIYVIVLLNIFKKTDSLFKIIKKCLVKFFLTNYCFRIIPQTHNIQYPLNYLKILISV